LRCTGGIQSMRGFSVVELVVVLLLLGILGATALSRFVEPSAFAPTTVSRATLAQGRFASQSSHARRGETITYSVAKVADDWQLDVRADGVSVRLASVPAHNTRLFVSNGGGPTELSGATSLTLTFDRRGSVDQGLLGAVALDPQLGIQLDVQGDSDRQLCVYPTGYVSDGVCE
jgi:type II secretory pathway pseudopilin PulG